MCKAQLLPWRKFLHRNVVVAVAIRKLPAVCGTALPCLQEHKPGTCPEKKDSSIHRRTSDWNPILILSLLLWLDLRSINIHPARNCISFHLWHRLVPSRNHISLYVESRVWVAGLQQPTKLATLWKKQCLFYIFPKHKGLSHITPPSVDKFHDSCRALSLFTFTLI